MKTLYYHGQVYTGRFPVASAFVVEGYRFLAVGNREDLEKFVDNDAKKVDLGGKFVCAGFNDSHMHLLNYGYTLSMAGLSEHTSSLGEMLEYLRTFDREEQTGAPGAEVRWLMGRGWNQDYFADGRRFPTRWDLDEVSRVRPICIIRACGHCCVVNSRALELMGITKETQQPEGGSFEKDPDGELNGIIRENAVEYVFRRIPAPSQDQIREMMRRAVKKLNTYGVTSCQTDDFMTLPVPYEQVIRAYQELEKEGELTVRVNEQAQFTAPQELQRFLDAGWNTGTGSAFFRIGPLKIVGDGSLGSRTAYLSRPYEDEPSGRGFPLMTRKQLEELAALANRHGMQTAVHAIGDGILDWILDAYEKALQENPRQDHRHGIVHCQITRPEQLERIAKLGLHVYAQTIFLDYDLRIVEARVGGELASSSYAFHTLKEKGVHVSNGSDCPVEQPDVMAGIQCAVTRRTLDGSGDPYLPREAMDVQEALDSYTAEGAYASFEEEQKGRIQAGMLADFVVLGENPFHVPAAELRRVPVEETYVGGQCVYRRGR